MTPQPSAQQIQHILAILEQQREAKQQEVDSLRALRDGSEEFTRCFLKNNDPLETAFKDFLTAKLKQAILDLRGFEAQIQHLKVQSSGIVTPFPLTR